MEAYCSSVEWTNIVTAFPVALYGPNVWCQIGN